MNCYRSLIVTLMFVLFTILANAKVSRECREIKGSLGVTFEVKNFKSVYSAPSRFEGMISVRVFDPKIKSLRFATLQVSKTRPRSSYYYRPTKLKLAATTSNFRVYRGKVLVKIKENFLGNYNITVGVPAEKGRDFCHHQLVMTKIKVLNSKNKSDTWSPVVQSLLIQKNKLKVGEPLILKLKIKDKSPICLKKCTQHFQAKFLSAGKLVHSYTYEMKKGKVDGIYIVTISGKELKSRGFKPGKYKVDLLNVFDKWKNFSFGLKDSLKKEFEILP